MRQESSERPVDADEGGTARPLLLRRVRPALDVRGRGW